MKKAIAAVLHYSSEHDDPEKRHQYCPRTAETWCKFQRNTIAGKTYKDNMSIDTAVSDIIKPVFSFKHLGFDELLKKSMHGETKNVNERSIILFGQNARNKFMLGIVL